MNNSNEITRRRFLRQASCAALGSTGVMSSVLNLQMTNSVAAQSMDDDYKALVCVFLAGGNDSYNMLVPTTADDYAQYQAVRGSSIAHPLSGNDALLPLNALETDGRSFGIHPAMPEVQQLFDDGNLTFIANVGTLIEPTTVTQYKNRSVNLPRSMFSHNSQQMQWQTSVPQGDSASGWAGRMADVLFDPSVPDTISMNFSLNGNNIWQAGQATTPYIVGKNGSVAVTGKTNNPNGEKYFRYQLLAGEMDDDVNSLIAQEYSNLFEQAYFGQFKRSIDQDRYFSNTYFAADAQIDSSRFNVDEKLAGQLKSVAQIIAARDDLGMKRQVFFVMLGGWDHHQELMETQHLLLESVSRALKGFWDTLGDLGVQDNVLTYTASDFGRTLRSNGRGTDHAWGGHQMVMGGSVLHGQRIHGRYPSAGEMGLAEGLDVDKNGRMLPTTSVDEFMAEMALWFGVPYNELETVFPNVRNFYSSTADYLPVGYLDQTLMPATALPTGVPLAVSLKDAESRAQSEQLHMTKSGLIAGTGLAATAAMVALRCRKDVS